MRKSGPRWLWVLCLLGAAAVARGEAGQGAGGEPGLAGEYFQRLGRLDAEDAAAASSLADWAYDRGLEHQAAELYRRVVALDPEDERAYDRLVKISDTTRLPEDADRRDRLLEQFGEEFSLHVAAHFLVIYDTDEAWALNRAVLLEKTHDLYYSALRRADLRPLPLTRRLVCVLFKEHGDFTEYARATDQMNLPWSSGYYSARTNRIAFYNDHSNPAFDETRREMRALEERLAALDEKLRDAARRNNLALVSAHRREYREARRELNRRRNRRDVVADLANAAKTTHEAAHQLAFNSGLQTRGVVYPLWLSEGLAANFEAADPSRGFGPYHDNPARAEALRQARAGDRLMPLSKFVTLTHPPADDADRAADLYAQSWGLFQFLFKKRHDQMRDYLRSLADDEPGLPDAAALRGAFEDAFGPIDRVEEQWTRYLRFLR